MRAIGVALLAFGGAWMGFRAAGELSQRVALLDDLVASLAFLEQELELGGCSLGECFCSLAQRGSGEVKKFFAACAQGMGHLEEESFPCLWGRLSAALPIGPEGQHILSALGETLGRCETDRQGRALAAATEELTLLTRRVREQYRRQGKVFQAVGVSAGAFLAILLL